MNECLEADIKIISEQIKRHPEGMRMVSARCRHGFPQAVFMNSYIDGRGMFPTIYWLTCPFLNKAIAGLESTGSITYFKNMLEENADLREEFLKSDASYRDERIKCLKGMFSINEKKYEQIQRDLLNVGIGGSKNPLLIKCLHMHLAHYISSRSNPVGKMCLLMIIDKYGDNCCEKGLCSTFE